MGFDKGTEPAPAPFWRKAYDGAASSIEGARLRFGAWNRERREAAAEKRAERQKNADPSSVTVPLWLVRATKFASWIATLSLIYFLWLYTLDIARDRAEALHITHAGNWVGELQFWFPHIVGFAVVAFGIPYVAKISIPTFVSLSWRQDPTAKVWALLIALAVSVVVISGTFAVQGHNIMERDRDAAVAVGEVEQEAAVLASRITDKRAELDDMVNNASVYVRTAASMSPEAYDVFLEQRRDDWQYDRLRSYRATSVDAQRLRNEIAGLRDQQARSTVTASVQREVVTERTGWIAQTLGWLEGVRAILLSIVMDIVALIMPLIALRLEQARNRQLGMAGGIPLHPWMIEKPNGEKLHDQSVHDAAYAVFDAGGTKEEAVAAAKAASRGQGIRTTLQDADTKETIIDKDGDLAVIVREHTRKMRGKDGQPIKMVIPAGPPQPDERGVETDGGSRIATSGVVEQQTEEHYAGSKATEVRETSISAVNTDDNERDQDGDKNAVEQPEVQPEPPMSYEEALAELATIDENDTPDEAEDRRGEPDAGAVESHQVEDKFAQEQQDDAGERGLAETDNQTPQHPQPPETRPERLLAADVAAE